MDNFFFVISKLVWGLLSPTNILFLAMLLGIVALIKGYKGVAKLLLIPTIGLLAGLMLYPIGDFLMHPLESRFSKPTTLPQHIDGIIILGGGEDIKTSSSWQHAQLGAGGDRYIGTAILAKHYPDVPVIFSGGNNSLRLQKLRSEGQIAQQLLMAVGIEQNRLLIESQSRNTHENFLFLKTVLPKENGRYLLVTSAFHIPRAVGIARQQGINVIAYPVDYRSNQPALRQISFNLIEHLVVLEPAWREWIGLSVYYFTGKTSAWFPKQEQ